MKDTRTGAERIADERRRQIEREGWTPEHDDEHEDGELATAAACYALQDHDVYVPGNGLHGGRIDWPWSAAWYKRHHDNRVRELEKAGALIAAEIDRLLRARG